MLKILFRLQDEFNLHSTALEAAYLIAAKYKQDWLASLLAQGENIKEFAQDIGAHPESIAALYRKLKRIEQLAIFLNHMQPGAYKHTVIDQMMEYIDKGISIIIEFGNFTSTFCYLLIANIITRRIHAEYIKKTEKFLGSQNEADEPQKINDHHRRSAQIFKPKRSTSNNFWHHRPRNAKILCFIIGSRSTAFRNRSGNIITNRHQNYCATE